jgi:hypothetical protein
VVNAPNPVIRNPTGPWMLVNIVGGGVVIPLVLLPAFIQRSRNNFLVLKQAYGAYESAEAEMPSAEPESTLSSTPPKPMNVAAANLAPHDGQNNRHLQSFAETFTTPASIILGFVMPSGCLLTEVSPVVIGLWQFFPIYVSLFRRVLHMALTCMSSIDGGTHHAESDHRSLLRMYGLPVILSVACQINLLCDALTPDTSSPTTLSALKFMQIDFWAIVGTMMYWLLIEAGVIVMLIATVCGVIAGPGAGVIVGWILREREVLSHQKILHANESRWSNAQNQGTSDGLPTEDQPLLIGGGDNV